MPGLGCSHCDYTGSVIVGGDRVWVSGGEVYDNETVYDCPRCSPDPDMPDDDFDDLWDDSGDDLDKDFEDDLAWTEDLFAEVE